MLVIRPILARTAPFRLFHSSLPPRQEQQPDTPFDIVDGIDGLEPLVAAVDATQSTHRAAIANANAAEPREIFEAWDVDTFYSPLAFLRSRRIRPPPARTNRPSVGPGATEAAHADVFRQFNIDPVHEANNHVLLSAFTTGMGKIYPRAETGLSWRSQRKVAQAIKRAKQKGAMPILTRPKFYVPRKQPPNEKQ